MSILFLALSVFFCFLWINANRKIKKIKNDFENYSTEKEEGLRRLVDSKNRYKLIVENMNEAVAAVDAGYRIKYCNQAFINMFCPGQAIEENKVFTEVTRHSWLNQLLQESLSAKKSQRAVMEFELQEQRRNSEVQAVFIPMQDTDFVALIFYDLTDLKKSEKMKRDFITNASHQLKTPLTAIQGYSETLIEDQEMPVTTRNDFIRKIQIKSIEAADLVSKLLQLSKLETNVEQTHSVNIEVEKMIQDLQRKFEGILQKHHIQFVHLKNKPVLIQTDLALFQLILENLLENAIKYSKTNGKVFLSAEYVGQKIIVEIRDEGIGIPEKDQERIFERFFRSHNAENHTHDGVGIGMAMVKSALEKINGTIEIKSTQDMGTTMSLTFPRQL